MTMRKGAAAKYVGITQDALDFHLLMGNVESRAEKDRFGECQVFEKNALDALKRLIEERRPVQAEGDRLDSDLKSLDEGVRADALRSLLRLGDPLILPPLLRELVGLRACKAELLAEAEETLVRMGAPAAVMLSGRRDDDGEYGELARAVLDRICPEGVGGKIARRAEKLAGLGGTKRPDLCVLKLLEIPDPRVIAPLFDSFDGRRGSCLTYRAEDAFARMGAQAAEPLLAALGHTHLRALAAAALGRIGAALALGPLLAALADDELVRAGAAAPRGPDCRRTGGAGGRQSEPSPARSIRAPTEGCVVRPASPTPACSTHSRTFWLRLTTRGPPGRVRTPSGLKGEFSV